MVKGKTRGGYFCAVCGRFTSGILPVRSRTRRVFQCVACEWPTCGKDLPHQFCQVHFQQLPDQDRAEVQSITADFRSASRQLSLISIYVLLVGFFCALVFGFFLRMLLGAIIALSLLVGIFFLIGWRETQITLQRNAQLKEIAAKNRDLLVPVLTPATKVMPSEKVHRFWGRYHYRCSICGQSVMIWRGVLQCPTCLRVLCKKHFGAGCPNHSSE